LILSREGGKQEAGTGPAFLCAIRWAEGYVVERGFTAITVAGTGCVVGAVSKQPGSAPGVHAGRFGLICCVSVSGVEELMLAGMLM
jgi:hypothetical protein